MWIARSEKLTKTSGLQFTVERDARPATFAEVIRGWCDDRAFRSLFNDLLADVPYSAFRWETPPVTAGTASHPFEFVLLDEPGLDRQPDVHAFADHLVGDQGSITTFENLGKNALLVVPLPIAAATAYGHLAAFVRFAPDHQRDALWQAVGEAMVQRMGRESVWLNTAGAGVSWLHVRLDERPKYYRYAPYAKSTR
jgi:hypothetical protein